MKPRDLIEHFGGVNATAAALGVKPPSVSDWLANDEVPELRQYQAEIATAGKFRADLPANRLPVQAQPPEPATPHDRAIEHRTRQESAT